VITYPLLFIIVPLPHNILRSCEGIRMMWMTIPLLYNLRCCSTGPSTTVALEMSRACCTNVALVRMPTTSASRYARLYVYESTSRAIGVTRAHHGRLVSPKRPTQSPLAFASRCKDNSSHIPSPVHSARSRHRNATRVSFFFPSLRLGTHARTLRLAI
jgi:hypothetical protein